MHDLPHIRRVSRRDLLRAAALTTAITAIDASTPPLLRRAYAQVLGDPLLTLEVVRPEVQLRLQLAVHGMVRSGDELVTDGSSDQARIVVHLPGAHTTTESLSEGEVVGRFGSPSVSSEMTRLVFDVTPPIPLTADALLDWAAWALSLDGRAALDEATADTTISGPARADAVRLQLPAAVDLSPLPGARMRLDLDPQTREGVSRSWAARFGRRIGPATVFTDEVAVPMRALDTPGYRKGSDPRDTGDAFPRPVGALDRERLVQATGDWSAAALTAYPAHEPIIATGLTLGADGADGALAGSWSGPGDLSVYAHVVTAGRTESVTITASGFLMPFGHPVIVTSADERVTEFDDAGEPVSVLRQVQRMEVIGTEVTIPADVPSGGRGVPFTAVALVPPEQMPVDPIVVPGVGTDDAFLLGDGTGQPLRLTFTATDHAGDTSLFTLPAVFIAAGAAPDATAGGVVDTVADWIADPAQDDTFAVPMGRQQVTFAAVDDDADLPLVTVEAASLRMSAALRQTDEEALQAAGQPAFAAEITTALIGLPALEGLTGNAGELTTVRYAEEFLTHGFGSANYGGVWARLDEPLSTAADRPGTGVASPDLTIEVLGLSKGASAELPGDGLDISPVDTLPDSAKILGVALRNLIPPITLGPDPAQVEGLPQITAELVGDTAATLASRVTLTWEPPLQTFRLAGTPTFIVAEDLSSVGLDNPFGSGSSTAEIVVTETTALGEDAVSRSSTEIALRDVTLQVPPTAPSVVVWAHTVDYASVDGDESLAVDVAQVAFTGPLNFLNPLQELLAENGVTWLPPYEDGVIQAGVAVTIPAFSIGVVSIDTFTAIVGMRIPLVDEPASVIVELGTVDDPVGVTILGIGGEAWFAMEVAGHPKGVFLDAGLAFVVEFSINVLIAKASIRGAFALGVRTVELTATNDVTGEVDTLNEVEIYALIDLSAELSVLGLLEVNGQISLELAYATASKMLSGSATFTFTSETLWGGSKTKSKTFDAAYPLGGGGSAAPSFAQLGAGDPPPAAAPSFGDRFSQPQWLEYGAAFA